VNGEAKMSALLHLSKNSQETLPNLGGGVPFAVKKRDMSL